MEFLYSCLHPKVYHEKISFYSWIYERNMCSSAACSCFFLLKACSWFLAHVFFIRLGLYHWRSSWFHSSAANYLLPLEPHQIVQNCTNWNLWLTGIIPMCNFYNQSLFHSSAYFAQLFSPFQLLIPVLYFLDFSLMLFKICHWYVLTPGCWSSSEVSRHRRTISNALRNTDEHNWVLVLSTVSVFQLMDCNIKGNT